MIRSANPHRPDLCDPDCRVHPRVYQPRWFPDLSKAAGSLPTDLHVYRVTYRTTWATVRVLDVSAHDPDGARAEAARLDPEYLVNVKPPRKVGERVYTQEVSQP